MKQTLCYSKRMIKRNTGIALPNHTRATGYNNDPHGCND